MVSIKVYNWERIKRGPLWYTIFITLIVFLIVYSFLKWWIMWWISVLFLFLVVIAAYIVIYLMSFKKTEITLYDWFLMVWEKKYNFDDLLWFNIELDNNWNFTNFIIVPKATWYPIKYTINSTFEEVKDFYTKLTELWLPLYADYENDRMYKIIRALKLW